MKCREAGASLPGEGSTRELGNDDALTVAKQLLRAKLQRRSWSDFNRRIVFSDWDTV